MIDKSANVTPMKCPICHVDMEWDELIKEYECPICKITESTISEMPDHAFDS